MAEASPEFCAEMASAEGMLPGYTALHAAAEGGGWFPIALAAPVDLIDAITPGSEANCFPRGYLIDSLQQPQVA